MKKVIKWLDEHNINYSLSTEGKDECITIILETDCIWINGFGKPMKFDKKVRVLYDKYLGYRVYEQYGYNLTKTLATCRKADMTIDVLNKRFNIV